jgi:hypothetical protein
MAPSMRGKVMDSTAAQKRQVATAHAIPTSIKTISLTAMGEQEDLSRVGGRHGAFARRIKRSKQIDEQCDQTQMSLVALWDEEAETSRKQRPSHLREGKETSFQRYR